ncbi:ABC transporter substrate-binding protein [Nonomuraea sp. NPDC049269]|uniref:ABC transporter substrate-binding protein n=1 Tax=Nonomuraea sp. NPDC049269 TaxID=3364349 RepID=UPI00371C14B7
MNHHLHTGKFLVSAAVVALALAGCSSSSSSDSGSGSGGKTEFTLTYAKSNNIQSPFEVLAKEYMTANPNITIKLEGKPNDTYGDSIRTQLQAGNAADVIETEGGSGQSRSVVPLAEAKFLEPLSDAVTKTIPSGSESLFQLNGTTYGEPLGISYVGLVYNTVAAQAAGLTAAPKSLDEVKAACTKAATAGKALFVLAGATVPNAGITSLIISATRVYADDPDWNTKRAGGKTTFAGTKGWQDTLQTIVDLNKAGCFQKGAEGAGFDAITNNMAKGTSVSFFGPLGSASELQKAAPQQKFVAEAFPPATADGKAFGVASATYSLSINAASQKKEAAKAFIDWLADPAQASLFAKASGGLPISGLQQQDLSTTIYADVADLLKKGDYTPLPNSGWKSAGVYDALGTGVQGLLTGQSTVDKVLKAMDTAWDQ